MKNNLWIRCTKTATAITLIFILLLQGILPVMAFENENNAVSSAWVSETLEIQYYVIRGIKNYWGIDCIDELLYSFDPDFTQSFNRFETECNFLHGTFNKFIIEEQLEINDIDWIANKLFNYYQTYGYIPCIYAFEIHLESGIAPRGKLISLAAAVTFFQRLGFAVTQFSVAHAAVVAASIVALAQPVPTVQLIQLVIGTAMTEINHGLMSVINLAQLLRSQIAVQVRTVLGLGTQEEVLIENSISQSLALVVAFQTGSTHFLAARNMAPGGGIFVGFPITRSVAIDRLLGKIDIVVNPRRPFCIRDTFSIMRWHARDIAYAAGGIPPQFDDPHHQNDPNRLLNFPHYHPMRPITGRMGGHAFFPWII